ncbi:MAG: hypothetical protein IKX28_01150 [Bacteroidales bacterium]|nr:hypothetical protein [Bacteroidales bacterium]
MRPKRNTGMRLITGNRILLIILAGLAGLGLLLQSCWSIIVLIHNCLGLLYEYWDYDWYLIAQLVVCLIGLWFVIRFFYDKGTGFRFGIKMLSVFLVLLLLLFAKFIVDRTDRYATSIFGGKIQSVEFLGDDDGYVFVVSKESDLAVYKTEDGGLSWIRIKKCDEKGAFYVSPKVSRKNNTILGTALLYDEIGSLESYCQFLFNTSSDSLSFDLDTIDISLGGQFLHYTDRESIDRLLDTNGLYWCNGADTLKRQIAVLASNSFRSRLFYSEDFGKTWNSFRIPHSSSGPISITEDYLYVSEATKLKKYGFDKENNRLMRIRQKARILKTYDADF